MNDQLRSHVTRVGFDLTLGKTHIAALVHLDQSIRQRRYIDTRRTGSYRHSFNMFATGIHGCMDRGLVLHHYRPDKSGPDSGGLRWHYTITKAGRLVLDLLREAGIYDEYVSVLPALEAAS